MAKIRSSEFLVNGKRQRFETHYSTKEEAFYVKLPDYMTNLIDSNPFEPTPDKAERLGQKRIDEYVKASSTRRKIILVETVPLKDRRHSYNGIEMAPVAVECGFLVMEEITDAHGNRHCIRSDGKAAYIAAEDYTAIPWTQEREDYFCAFCDMIADANTRLIDFVKRCAEKPELIDARALPALMNRTDELSA